MGDFKDYGIAMKMRDIVVKIVTKELVAQRPAYNYATVSRIDRRNQRVFVTYASNPGVEVPIPLGGVCPAAVGQIVVVDGLPGDRRIVDVMGVAATQIPGDILLTFNTRAHLGYVATDGATYNNVAPYLDLAWALGTSDSAATFVVPNKTTPIVGATILIKL